ncbi:hypothetical protein INTERNEXUS_223 [Bacillus phage vB_BspM_Internexus]|nr:hypothetical protein INTERNEXUS_223 [Bacillus phage vB_BspM_Internexus]
MIQKLISGDFLNKKLVSISNIQPYNVLNEYLDRESIYDDYPVVRNKGEIGFTVKESVTFKFENDVCLNVFAFSSDDPKMDYSVTDYNENDISINSLIGKKIKTFRQIGEQEFILIFEDKLEVYVGIDDGILNWEITKDGSYFIERDKDLLVAN